MNKMTSIEIEDITLSDIKAIRRTRPNCAIDKCRYKATSHYGLCKHHCGEHKRDREDCVICTESVKQPISCGHWMHFECIMKTGKKECPLCMMTLKLTKEEQQQFKKHNKNKRMEIRGENIIERYRIESERFRLFLDEELGGNELLTWNNRMMASLSFISQFQNSFRI
jgi:hypothetical protein